MPNKWTADCNKYLCAHNGKEFDFPYLCRRMTILGLKLPVILQIAGKKPWEVPFLDTMELWKFGDYKSYTSLHLLSNVLGIPSSKDDMDGSMVCDVYWGAQTVEDRERSLHRIATYCQKDVITAAQVYLKLHGEDLVESENIELKEILHDIADERGEINRHRLGRWIKRHEQQIVDGLRFARCSGNTSAERWRVESVSSVLSDSDAQEEKKC